MAPLLSWTSRRTGRALAALAAALSFGIAIYTAISQVDRVLRLYDGLWMIAGAAVALALALNALIKAGTLKQSPLKQLVAATSVGIVGGVPLLDLCYEEDSQAEVDMNVVMTEDGGLVETQATAEKGSYSRSQLNGMIDMAEAGIRDIFAAQRAVLGR